MRPSNITAALLAVTLALPASAYAQPTTRQGNPLSSIFGCDAGGNKQTGGAVIGGLVGGVIGNNLAKNERGLGTVLGAAAGAAAGSYIGCRMQRSDQQKAQIAAQNALDRGGSQSWSNPQTGASGDVRVVSTSTSQSANDPPVSMSGMRFAAGVEPVSNYAAAGGRYKSANTVNLRGGPSTAAPVVGKLRPGETIDAVAAQSVVRPVSTGQAYAGGGETCRTFDQTIRTQGGAPETQRYTACKGGNGEWVVQS